MRVNSSRWILIVSPNTRLNRYSLPLSYSASSADLSLFSHPQFLLSFLTRARPLRGLSSPLSRYESRWYVVCPYFVSLYPALSTLVTYLMTISIWQVSDESRRRCTVLYGQQSDEDQGFPRKWTLIFEHTFWFESWHIYDTIYCEILIIAD